MKFHERRAALRRIPAFLAYGPHEIEVVQEHILRDATRGKEIPLRIYAPRSGGPHPVIVFSHGAGDSNASSPLLMRHWATHGYVVILPTHLFGPRPLLERSIARLRQELMRPREMGPAAWKERTSDIAAVIDNLDALAELGALKGRMDSTRIGVGGHSFGGYTALLIAGATLTDPKTGETFCFEDPRPRAFMVISGPGHDDMGLTGESWARLERPMMVFTGSRDPGYVRGAGPMWRAEPYLCGPCGGKHLVYIHGAHHMSYNGPLFDLPLRDPAKRGPVANGIRAIARRIARVLPAVDQVGIFDYSRIAGVAFWDAYLKDDEPAKAFLLSHALDIYSGQLVKTEAK